MKFKIMLAALVLLTGVYGWGNGLSIHDDPVFSNDVTFWTNTDMYGTHDYFAERALEILEEQAPEEAEWIRVRYYYYGTELPDSYGYSESINDRIGQILLFDNNGHLVDNSLAKLALKRYDLTLATLGRGEYGTASKWVGVLSSYVSDAGLFARVIESPKNGKMYEDYMLYLTDIVYPSVEFEEVYGDYISFDGELEIISPYDAIIRLGQQTYLGDDGKCSAQWMDDNYDINELEFVGCGGKNINNLVNTIVDVLHTTYQQAVNNVTSETYSYDWDSYIYQETTKPVEPVPEIEVIETEPEPKPETETIPYEEEIIEVPKATDDGSKTGEPGVKEPSLPKQDNQSNGLGLWSILLVLILLFAIFFLTYKSVPKAKGGRVVNKKSEKAKAPVRVTKPSMASKTKTAKPATKKPRNTKSASRSTRSKKK